MGRQVGGAAADTAEGQRKFCRALWAEDKTAKGYSLGDVLVSHRGHSPRSGQGPTNGFKPGGFMSSHLPDLGTPPSPPSLTPPQDVP